MKDGTSTPSNTACSRTWDEFYASKDKNLRFPDEDLVRLFLGSYLPTLPKTGAILDHGFGSGNNLLFLATRGYACSGVEVSQAAIDVARDLFSRAGCTGVDLQLFNGQDLPYPDDSFDIVYSWNAIHYNGTRDKVAHVLGEFHRVLKPGGHLLLSTVSPESSVIASRGTRLSGESVCVGSSVYDNRDGLVFFCLPAIEDWGPLLARFHGIEYGYQKTYLFLPDKVHAAYLIHALK